MELKEIKQKALELKTLNRIELNKNVSELKNAGVSFLGCVAFVQFNQNISLFEARKETLELDCWTKKDKEEIDFYNNQMLSEFEDEK